MIQGESNVLEQDDEEACNNEWLLSNISFLNIIEAHL
jgi:hypothetical protein